MATFGDPRLPTNFWAKIELIPFSTCWWWLGGLTVGGYGNFWVGSRSSDDRRLALTHRLSYETFVGPIPVGHDIDHFVCDNRACCNPEHIRPVTRRENVLRSSGFAAENAAKDACSMGHSFDYIRSDGQRRCRKCEALVMRQYRARRKESHA